MTAVPATWWRRLTLRARLILIGTAGLLVGLGLGGLLLIAVLQVTLRNSVDDGARRTAGDVAALINAGRLPDPVPVSGTPVVQVIDAQGRIRAASLGADRLTPILRPAEVAAALRGEVVTVSGSRAATNGDLRVVAMAAGGPEDRRTVLVAVPDHDIVAAVATVRRGLLIAYPVLVAVLAVLAWWVVGWTLRPVEALRRGAEEITGRGGRLPVPDGRDEVYRLAVTLNGMLDRLDRARLRQRAFVGDAAHELRSPLASLRTQVDVAAHLGEALDPGEMLPDITRLGHLVDDLLLLARADEGDPALRRREPVELCGLLAEAAQAQAGARVPVSVDCAGEYWTLGDPVALRRIVDNLLSNAVRHAASRVALRAGPGSVPPGGPAAETVTVSVLDDGPGIPAADRGRVFDRFTRLDDARGRDGGGAGLGLAIVRELVRLHGGVVELSDARPGLRAAVTLARYGPDGAAIRSPVSPD